MLAQTFPEGLYHAKQSPVWVWLEEGLALGGGSQPLLTGLGGLGPQGLDTFIFN